MITKLEAPLRRELSIEGEPYVLTITPTGFVLTPKGRRRGYEMDWRAFVSGETALATALNASIGSAPAARRSTPESREAQQKVPPAPAPTPAKRAKRTPR